MNLIEEEEKLDQIINKYKDLGTVNNKELDEKQKQLLEQLEKLGINKKQAIKMLRGENNG